jgi:uncharacterized protein (TIGR02001 family)
LGAIHSSYSHYSSYGRGRAYTEAYVGLAGKILSTRVSVSPDYLKSGTWSVYGEVNGNVPVGSRFRLTGHVGLLKPLRRASYDSFRTASDWRLGIARDIGRATITAAWTGVHRDHEIYEVRRHSHQALVLGLNYAF